MAKHDQIREGAGTVAIELTLLRARGAGMFTGAIAALIVSCVASSALPASTTGTSTAVHDCSGVKRTCGAWAAKDKKTCRTCQQAQCKTENGKDVLAGNKTQTECYEGHGPPP